MVYMTELRKDRRSLMREQPSVSCALDLLRVAVPVVVVASVVVSVLLSRDYLCGLQFLIMHRDMDAQPNPAPAAAPAPASP